MTAERSAAIVDSKLQCAGIATETLRFVGGHAAMEAGTDAEHRSGDGQSLFFVGGKQRIGAVLQSGGEFPAEVIGVLYAGVHSLATGGRMHMGGVAGEEDAALSIAVNHADVCTVER